MEMGQEEKRICKSTLMEILFLLVYANNRPCTLSVVVHLPMKTCFRFFFYFSNVFFGIYFPLKIKAVDDFSGDVKLVPV